MKIVFMGTPLFAAEVLEMLIKEHQVVMVVTQPDKAVGRKKIKTPSIVKEIALKHQIEVFQPEKNQRRLSKNHRCKTRFYYHCRLWTNLAKSFIRSNKSH